MLSEEKRFVIYWQLLRTDEIVVNNDLTRQGRILFLLFG